MWYCNCVVYPPESRRSIQLVTLLRCPLLVEVLLQLARCKHHYWTCTLQTSMVNMYVFNHDMVWRVPAVCVICSKRHSWLQSFSKNCTNVAGWSSLGFLVLTCRYTSRVRDEISEYCAQSLQKNLGSVTIAGSIKSHVALDIQGATHSRLIWKTRPKLFTKRVKSSHIFVSSPCQHSSKKTVEIRRVLSAYRASWSKRRHRLGR